MSDAVGNILVSSLNQRWDEYRDKYKTCQREFSEEAVHDLRVAERRLLAVLDMVRTLDPQPRVQKARRFLKDQLDELDELRDVQVMLVEVTENIQGLPQLGLFQNHLQKRETRLLRVARKKIRASRPTDVKKRIIKVRGTFEKQTHGKVFSTRLLHAMDNAYARVMQAYAEMSVQDTASMHQVRIAFKKFRYMAEIVRPILPEPPESYFQQMHNYQSVLGDIRDVAIFVGTLTDFAEEDNSSLDSQPILHQYQKRLAELITAYFEDKGELTAFWRVAPDQPFPWESNHDPVHRSPRHRSTSGEQRPHRRRQPAPADRQGSQEDASDRAGPEGIGSADRPGSEQPLSPGGPDGAHPSEEV